MNGSGKQSKTTNQPNNCTFPKPSSTSARAFGGKQLPLQCFFALGGDMDIRFAGPFKLHVRGRETTFPQLGTSRGNAASTPLRQQQLSERDQYVKPDPLLCLNWANEAPVHNDGMECKALIDSETKMLTITVSLMKQLGQPYSN